MSAHRGAEPRESAANDPRSILRRFLALNEARLKRTREPLRARQKDFLLLLPLLFEVNHPLLPGYVNRETPCGVAAYRPDEATLEAARRLAKSFQWRHQPSGPPVVQGIYFIGSPGSVAYTSGSDFDIWLCHDPALSPEQLELLMTKARRIEEWATGIELEVHFFAVDVDRFRSCEPMELTSESSGTAQHRLLLEEFYRSTILVAGYFPIWWLVPPEQEGRYDEYVAELRGRRYMNLEEGLDFGGLGHAPAEEFFGAAVWQLSKGIGSPYKSVLKLLLVEAYASEYPDTELLAMRFKRTVYAGEEGLERFDPYLMMLEKVEGYLRERSDTQRLELARRCFYIKVAERLSEPVRGPADWRRLVIAGTVESWGWLAGDYALMDNRDEWTIQRVSQERRILFEALTDSYRFLSDFVRRHGGEQRLSQGDLNILGRKLFAAYERKAGKIDLINRGIRRDLWCQQLSLHEARTRQGDSGWLLYEGVVGSEAARRETPIRRSRSVVELTAWAYFNRVLDRNSSLVVHQRLSDLTSGDVGILLDNLRFHFPPEVLAHTTVEAYARPESVMRAALFVNIGMPAPDRTALAREGGGDALSFGAAHESQLLCVDDVLVTSWHEILSRRYGGAEGLAEWLCDYLKWWPLGSGGRPEPVRVFGLGANRGMSVARRLEELLGDVIGCYYGDRYPPVVRYVFAIGTRYVVLQGEDGAVGFRVAESVEALLQYLGRPQSAFSPVVIDRQALGDTVLPAICQLGRPGRIQLYYRPLRDEVEVFVIDERGSVFAQRQPFHTTAVLLSQYSQFFDAVMNRMGLLMQEGEELTPPGALEFYAVSRDGGGKTRVERKAPEFGRNRTYLSIQVLVDSDADGRTVFTLYCNDQEFSNLEHGGNLFVEVVRYVLSLRPSGDAYPIYITDISLSRSVLGEGLKKVQTVHFLKYKQRIEDQLRRAMRQAGG